MTRSEFVGNTLKIINERNDAKEVMECVVRRILDVDELEDCDVNIDNMVESLNARLSKDRYYVANVGGKFRLLEEPTVGIAGPMLGVMIRELNLDTVREDYERAIDSADDDPADALTSACSMLESVCKKILDEMEVGYPTKETIGSLANEVQKHLNLSPARKDIEDDIRQILSGLITVANGIGALRTHAGDAHGHAKLRYKVDPRTAKLAIHASSTLAMFYIDTWKKQSVKY